MAHIISSAPPLLGQAPPQERTDLFRKKMEAGAPRRLGLVIPIPHAPCSVMVYTYTSKARYENPFIAVYILYSYMEPLRVWRARAWQEGPGQGISRKRVQRTMI